MLPVSDRSRYSSYLRCPRLRWWAYHHAGRGIRPDRVDMSILFGLALHEACRAVLSGGDPYAAAQRVFNGQLPAADAEAYDEWNALLRASIHLLVRRVVPAIMDGRSLVSVEREMLIGGDGVIIMVRPDAVLRERDDHVLILNLKTSSVLSSQLDLMLQPHIEVAAVSRVVPATAYSILPVGIVREKPSESRLLTAWEKDGELRWSYTWVDEDGASRRLGRGWTRVPAWRIYGVDEWFDRLASGTVLPAGDPFAGLYRVDLPVSIDVSVAERILSQMVAHERRVIDAARNVARAPDFHLALDEHFPQNLMACHMPGRCSFEDICFTYSVGREEIPYGYVRRQPHHKLEEDIIA